MVTEVGPAAFGPAVECGSGDGVGPAAGVGHRESSNQAGASIDWEVNSVCRNHFYDMDLNLAYSDPENLLHLILKLPIIYPHLFNIFFSCLTQPKHASVK